MGARSRRVIAALFVAAAASGAVPAEAAAGDVVVSVGSPTSCDVGSTVVIPVDVHNGTANDVTVAAVTFTAGFADAPDPPVPGALTIGTVVASGGTLGAEPRWLVSNAGTFTFRVTVTVSSPDATFDRTGTTQVSCFPVPSTTTTTTSPSPTITLPASSSTEPPETSAQSTVSSVGAGPTTRPTVLDPTVLATTVPASATSRPNPPATSAPTSSTAPSPGETDGSSGATSTTAPELASVWETSRRRLVVGQPTWVTVQFIVPDRGSTPSVPTSVENASTTSSILGPACHAKASIVVDPAVVSVLSDVDQHFWPCKTREATHTVSWLVKPLVAAQTSIGVTYTLDDATVVTGTQLALDIEADVSTTAASPSSTSTTVPPPAPPKPRGSAWTPTLLVVGLVSAGGGTWAVRRRRHRAAPVGVMPVLATDGRPKVFLSYSRRDADEVTRIEQELDVNGFETWRDIDDIAGGTAWRSAIAEALDSSIAVVLLLSPAAMASTNVAREISLADDAKRPILPVLIDGDGKLSGTFRYILADTQIIDVRGAARARGVRQLLQALHAKEVRRSLPPPAPPAEGTLPPPSALPPPTLVAGEHETS